jgi:alpha-galactosidase
MAESAGHAEHIKDKQTTTGASISRPLNVVFLGAGSAFFPRLFTDILNLPGATKGTMGLVDIDQDRLELNTQLAAKLIERAGADWTVKATTDRREVLGGADYIINCIEVSGTECVRLDNDIPAKYGIDQCIGDTIGPGGLMKALRTVPVFLEVLEDIEELCPDAQVLNYTNPMSIMCYSAALASDAKVIGLCHSVQGTSRHLADYADVPYEELQFRCGGVNHLAWFTELTHKGKDLYPILKEKTADEGELWEKDPVRFDMMKHFGYFITESSGHLSEYLPYYRKRPELVKYFCRDKYLGGSSFYANNWPTWRKDADENRRKQISGEQDMPPFERSHEYASDIIFGMETNQPHVIYGSVPNDGLIDNLPVHGVVEVACLVDRNGITPTHFGPLPPQCATVCNWQMGMYEMAALACVNRSKEQATQALLLDPLTAAVCSPGEIRKMAEELFEAEKAFLPEDFA